jgi:probable rRNA maturation factor
MVIDVRIDAAFRRQVTRPQVMAWCRAALTAENALPGASLTVWFTNDESLRDLNKRYRGVDEATDVLSFAQEPQPDFIAGNGRGSYLGDIAISVPRAEQQAVEQKHSLTEELRLLTVHGVLHLLGYDHESPEAEKAMWARQDAILASLPAKVGAQ